MTTSAYRLTSAPKFAEFTAFDCAFCGHLELGKPVFLTSGGNTIAAGSGCASIALYGRKDARTVARMRREFDSIEFAARQADALRSERRTAYARALVAFEGRLPGYDADLERARTTYHRSGGPAALGKFGEWIARVADTGEFA